MRGQRSGVAVAGVAAATLLGQQFEGLHLLRPQRSRLDQHLPQRTTAPVALPCGGGRRQGFLRQQFVAQGEQTEESIAICRGGKHGASRASAESWGAEPHPPTPSPKPTHRGARGSQKGLVFLPPAP